MVAQRSRLGPIRVTAHAAKAGVNTDAYAEVDERKARLTRGFGRENVRSAVIGSAVPVDGLSASAIARGSVIDASPPAAGLTIGSTHA